MTKHEAQKRPYQCKNCFGTLTYVFRKRGNLGGYGRRCRSCERDRQITYATRRPERYKEIRKYSKIKANYGLSKEQYEAMYDAQKGACAICLSTTKMLGVDHNHKTGVIRKLLCPACNMVVGHLKDDPAVCERFMIYLKEFV